MCLSSSSHWSAQTWRVCQGSLAMDHAWDMCVSAKYSPASWHSHWLPHTRTSIIIRTPHHPHLPEDELPIRIFPFFFVFELARVFLKSVAVRLETARQLVSFPSFLIWCRFSFSVDIFCWLQTPQLLQYFFLSLFSCSLLVSFLYFSFIAFIFVLCEVSIFILVLVERK